MHGLLPISPVLVATDCHRKIVAPPRLGRVALSANTHPRTLADPASRILAPCCPTPAHVEAVDRRLYLVPTSIHRASDWPTTRPVAAPSHQQQQVLPQL